LRLKAFHRASENTKKEEWSIGVVECWSTGETSVQQGTKDRSQRASRKRVNLRDVEREKEELKNTDSDLVEFSY
jgi:hypothetical protein